MCLSTGTIDSAAVTFASAGLVPSLFASQCVCVARHALCSVSLPKLEQESSFVFASLRGSDVNVCEPEDCLLVRLSHPLCLCFDTLIE